ncbi:MAG: pyroglutamyl-peptidase I [Alteromonadales bacterium]|nr:pyroglutamyl-peptidase I [Alteromonadales bacterium]
MKKVLITGFSPFNAQSMNPSQLLLPDLKTHFKNSTIKLFTLLLPVEQHSAINESITAIEKYQPDIVIALGQAAGRADITIERIAINIDDYPIADNAGNQPIDQPIYEQGENAYFSTLPIKAIAQAIRSQEIKASISNSAGTYVCNHLMYGLLHYAKVQDTKNKPLQVGFIHIPCIPEQITDKPLATMLLSDIQRAIVIAVECVVKQGEDIKLSEGKIC